MRGKIFDFTDKFLNPALTPAELGDLIKSGDKDGIIFVSTQLSEKLANRKLTGIIINLITILVALPTLYFLMFSMFQKDGFNLMTIFVGSLMLVIAANNLRFIQAFGKGTAELSYVINFLENLGTFK